MMWQKMQNWSFGPKLQLEANAYQIYHSTLMGSKSQTELDRLHQLHILDIAEDNKDRSWECTKVER